MRLSMLLCLALILPMGFGTPATAQEPGRHITVSGEASVDLPPDMATITLGVMTQGETAADALGANSQAMGQVMDLLREQGVAETDLQTSGLSLFPNRSNRPGEGPGVEFRGFTASSTVTAKIRDMDSVGAVLDTAVGAGANTFMGISFGLQDTEKVMNDARLQAVANARAKAELLAEASGVSLGEVYAISEGAGRAGPVSYDFRMSQAEGGVPIAGGEVSTRATVTITYKIAE